MNNLGKAALGGIIGTAVMTMIMFVAPMMGMPKMSPPDMLAGMMGLPIIVGWLMHFMIGIIFALGYTLVFSPKVKINNLFVKGAAFGFLAFIFSRIAMAMMGAMMGGMPQPDGSMVLVIMGGIIGHVVFGIVVAKVIGDEIQ